jgi:hypothetical protein
MAYMNQDKKSKIAAALKQVVPANWKYSLRVRHHSTIVMTISAAPVDLIGAHKQSEYFDPATETYTTVNNYHFRSHLDDECVADVFEKIFECLNLDNFDESDIQTDYFHVGHYVDLNIGSWDKPFVVTSQLKQAA